MAKFIYRMQSILNIKLKMETQAKQEFATAKGLLDEELEKLQAYQERKLWYEQEARRLLAGALDFLEISANQEAILRMEEFIVLQRQAVEKAQERLEAARVTLQEVMQEREIQEKLREKAFEAFLAEEKAQEGKEIDQLTSYTYGKRINENNAVSGA